MKMSTPINASLSVKIGVLIGSVLVADWLFLSQPVGFALGVFLAAFTLALCWISPHLIKARSGKILLAGLLGLCIALVIDPSGLAFTLYLFGLGALLSLQKRHTAQNALATALDAFALPVWALMQGLRDRRLLLRAAKRRPTPPDKKRGTLKLFFVPVLLGALFLFFFALANPVIGNAFSSLHFNLGELITRLIFLHGPFCLALGLLIWAILRPHFHPCPNETSTPPNLDPWINKTSLIVSLIFFNLIFALQNGLDIAFLLGDTALLPEGMSYADYAHSGAYPLIVTALMAAVYVLVVFSEHQHKLHTPLAEKLVALWLLQNVFLVGAAANRLLNYIEVYSLTYLRLSALIWMALVACGLLLTFIRIWQKKSNFWLINSNMLVLVATLYACCFIPLGSLIATYNLQHGASTSDEASIDYTYLQQDIGEDAIPALERVIATVPEANKEARTTAMELEKSLRASLENNWRSWTLRRAWLLNLIPQEVATESPSQNRTPK